MKILITTIVEVEDLEELKEVLIQENYPDEFFIKLSKGEKMRHEDKVNNYSAEYQIIDNVN